MPRANVGLRQRVDMGRHIQSVRSIGWTWGAANEDCDTVCTGTVDFSFDDSPWGVCPQGWTCSGDATKQEKGYGLEQYECHGVVGAGYFHFGGDQSEGEANSNIFQVPATATTLSWMRAGGANSPSGFYLKKAADGAVLCEKTNGADTDTLFSESCDVSNVAGQSVFINIKDTKSNNWGKVYVDDIKFTDESGNEVSIPIPNAYFKSVLAENDRGALNMWSFLFPNEATDEPLESFRVSTTKIEKYTGIQLWSKLQGRKINREKGRVRSMW